MNMDSKFIDLEEIKKPININLKDDKGKIDSIKIIEIEKQTLKELSAETKIDNIDFDDNGENYNNNLLDQGSIEKHETLDKKPGLKKRAEKYKKEKTKKSNKIEELLGKDNKKIIKDDRDNIYKDKIDKRKKDAEQSDVEGIKDENIEKIETIDDIEELEEAEEISEESDDEIDMLAEKALNGEAIIDNPGNISLAGIDKELLNPELNIENVENTERVSEEKFGVNRARVFYNIDKEIYSTRSTSLFSKSKLKSIKKGILFPASMASAIFFVSFIVIIIMLLFFKSVSASSLEDNIIKDESILAKIAKQMDEERRLAALRLEEERRKLEEDRRNLESAINEELLKKEADIENKYLQKLKELEKGGITTEEKKQLEKEKAEALIKAREERDNKISEQDKLIEEKDAKIKVVMDNLKQESENYEQEIIRIKKEYEEKRLEEQRRIEIANQRLNELKDTEDKITQFNSFVYQLISNAMSEYKDGKIDPAVQSLNSVLKYYNSNLDFVLAHNELKKKMDTDVFFVEAIGGLIEKSKDSILNNREYTQILNRFNKVIGFYNRAENFNNNQEYEKSSKEYMKVLKEFDEINDSYVKLNDVEKKIQDSLANNYLNSAKELIRGKKYQDALDELYLIVEKAPLSNLKDSAIEEIVNINKIISDNSKIDADNENAKIIFDQAENLMKTKNYENAKNLYDQIVLNYPSSDYTKKALNESRKIKEILNKNEITDQQKGLKEKFLENYKLYQYYNDKGDFERARIYYFQALRDSFDIYAENSITDFKKEEDRYIELLVKNNLESQNKENAKVLFDQAENYKKSEDYFSAKKLYDQIISNYPLSDYTKKALEESKYIDSILNKQETNSEDYKKELKERFLDNYKKYQYYNKMGDFERARIYYFEALKNSFDTYTDSSIIDFKKEEDKYIEDLVKTNLRNKDQYIEYLINDYNKKIKKIESEYKDLKDRYEELEKQYKDNTISKKERNKIKKEIEDSIREKHILLKREEISEERKKVENEFKGQLDKIKKSIEISYKN